MPARTEAGTRALEQVLGFEEFMRRVEAEHLKRVIIGHPELFDKYLPYAMAFGVEKTWARAFEGIYKQPPTWYVGPNITHFSVGNFSSSLATLSSQAGSSMTSSPRTSSGSGFGGGGGGGGGGGFSGGGGGGGGGGGLWGQRGPPGARRPKAAPVPGALLSPEGGVPLAPAAPRGVLTRRAPPAPPA